MAKLMIVNGSPRAPRSNSKKYAALFRDFWQGEADEYNVTARDHEGACARMTETEHILFVFPLYADGVPAVLMRFLKALEENVPASRPTVHVLVNCGFLEPEQNAVALEMMRLFCSQCGLPFGSSLAIGSGEAILGTPFRFLVKRGIKKLARAMTVGRPQTLRVTMPLPKSLYIRAAEQYWLSYGSRYGTTREQMDSMEIEKD